MSDDKVIDDKILEIEKELESSDEPVEKVDDSQTGKADKHVKGEDDVHATVDCIEDIEPEDW